MGRRHQNEAAGTETVETLVGQLEASLEAQAGEPEAGQAGEPAGEPEAEARPLFRKKTAEERDAEPKRARVQNDADDIAACLELRATGLSYMKIEEKLCWKDSHGNRAWRICRDYALTAPETVN